MKTQLIMLSTPIIVSDEKPQSNDIVYVNNDMYNHEIRTFTTAFGDANLDDCIKIIAIDKSYVKYNHSLPSIDWNGLEKEFRWIDIEKCADKWCKDNEEISGSSFNDSHSFKEGFKKAQSLNEKKFSLEDMEGFIDYMYSHKTAHKYKDGYGDFQVFTDLMKQYIQSIQQPKVFNIEIKTEEYDHDEDWSEISGAFEICKYRPKITNNSIKILKKL